MLILICILWYYIYKYVPGSSQLLPYLWTFTRKYITIYLRYDLDVLLRVRLEHCINPHNFAHVKVSVVINKGRIAAPYFRMWEYTLNKWHRLGGGGSGKGNDRWFFSTWTSSRPSPHKILFMYVKWACFYQPEDDGRKPPCACAQG